LHGYEDERKKGMKMTPYGYVQIISNINHIAEAANLYLEKGFNLNAILPLPDPMQKVLLFKEQYKRPTIAGVVDKRKKK
jgi:hypothetical protein